MNQSYFEVFLAVVECKSVSRAAEKLFLSQSTVSHRLKMLENEIGCLLFERAQGQRECVLTAKGEALCRSHAGGSTQQGYQKFF
ncbi:MAG: LysR family transcriptional regulator [Ruthenibacterium lactatiformans]